MATGKIKFIALSLFIFLLSGCGLEQEVQALEKETPQEKSWAFIQFNVPEEENSMETYYYYGFVSTALLQEIDNNERQQGFIRLERVRYWGDDDLIHRYSDQMDSGVLTFRIEDVRRIRHLKTDPLEGSNSAEPADPIEEPAPPIEPETETESEAPAAETPAADTPASETSGHTEIS